MSCTISPFFKIMTYVFNSFFSLTFLIWIFSFWIYDWVRAELGINNYIQKDRVCKINNILDLLSNTHTLSNRILQYNEYLTDKLVDCYMEARLLQSNVPIVTGIYRPVNQSESKFMINHGMWIIISMFPYILCTLFLKMQFYWGNCTEFGSYHRSICVCCTVGAYIIKSFACLSECRG